MARTKSSFILKDVSGAIGKELVIKQYASGTVITAYPDMSRTKTSDLQQLKQKHFAKAVAYAQSIVRNPVLKKASTKKLKKGERVYNAAIKDYLSKNQLGVGLGADDSIPAVVPKKRDSKK